MINHKIILWFLCITSILIFSFHASAQLHLELKDNPKYIKNVNELWQLKVSNLGNQALRVQISLELNDSANQLLYSGNSRAQEVPPGSRTISQNDCVPITDEQLDPAAFPLKPGIYFFRFKLIDAGTNQLLFAGGITIDSREVKNGLAALTNNKVRLGGTASVMGQQSDFSGINTQVPANYTRVLLNPTLTIFDVPITLNYIYSTENNPIKQPINQFSVQFNPDQYRANLEAKLMEKVGSVKDFKNPSDLKQLDGYKSILKEKPNAALEKASAEMGGKDKLEEIQKKIKEAENLDQVLNNPDMQTQLQQYNSLAQKYNIQSEADIDKNANIPKSDKEKLKKGYAVKKQADALQKKKTEADALKKKHKKALALKEKTDGIDKGDLGGLLSNKSNLQAGLQQFGMMGPGTKILSSIQTLAIGSTYPYFSEQTLNGARVDGFQLEMNPSLFYFNIVNGKSARKAYENTFSETNFAADQNLSALKVGLGKKDATHLFFTGVKIQDVNDTSQHPPGVSFTPRENYLLGSDLQFSFFKNALLFGGEVNGSLYTPDQNAPPLPSDANYETGLGLPFEDKIVAEMNSVSKTGLAYKGFTNILMNKSTSNISAKISYVEPSYYSMGNEFLLRDRQTIQINGSQTLFKSKFTLLGYYEENTNGLVPFATLFKTIFTRYGGSIKLNTKPVTVMLNYAPYFQSISSMGDSGSYTNTGEMISSTFLFKYKLSKKVYAQTQFGNSYQKLSGKVQALVSSYNFMQNINSPILSLQINATFSPNQNLGGQERNVFTGNINSTIRLFKIWSNTIGYIHYEYAGIELKTGFYYMLQLPIGSHMLVEARINKNNYINEIYSQTNFDEIYMRYGLKIQF